MTENDPTCEWFHGSPFRLTVLRAGCSITRNRRLAEAFSHKPYLVTIDDNGRIRHNGVIRGNLYGVLDVDVSDIVSHPRPTMPKGMEWLTTRDLQLKLIGVVVGLPDEQLPLEEVEHWRSKAPEKHLLDAGFQIRGFTESDQQVTRELVLEGCGENWGYIDESRNPDLDDIHAYYIARGHTVILAEDSKGLLGTGTLVVEDNKAQMVRVSVKASEQRRGIASAIVEELIQVARDRGVVKIEVETNSNWYSAIRLYQRHGFVKYSHDDESVYLVLELVQS